jgi:hypothetical protein
MMTTTTTRKGEKERTERREWERSMGREKTPPFDKRVRRIMEIDV